MDERAWVRPAVNAVELEGFNLKGKKKNIVGWVLKHFESIPFKYSLTF